MAASFNHLYGDHLVLPEAVIDDAVALLPGLDGRKMSKSYDNTIPLFAPRDQMRKLIMGILTDSRMPGEPKSTEGSAVFQLYQAFASAEEAQALAKAFADGIAWGDAKQTVFERIDREIAPLREHYNAMMANPAEVESILLAGAEKARAISVPFMRELRHAVGLRALQSQVQASTAKVHKSTLPVFKQYREADGKFYFKLVDATGAVLLQSPAFDSPREPGQLIARLKTAEPQAIELIRPWWLAAQSPESVLAQLTEA